MEMIYETDTLVQTYHGSMHPGGLRLTDRAVRRAGLAAGMRVADIGCGTGATAAFLRGKYQLRVVGLEISDKLIDIGLKSWPGLNLIRWNCDTLPFEDDTLDAVFFECTLSLLGDTRRILLQCSKALRKKGTIIISDVFAKQRLETGKTPLTIEELSGILPGAGFDSVIQEDHTAALRTYIAGLREKNGNSFDACSFFGAAGDAGVRLSDLRYMLTIARKI